MRLDIHVHYDAYQVRAAIAPVLEAIHELRKLHMALSAKLQAAVDDVNARLGQTNTELDAIAVALAGSPDVAGAAVAAALAKVGIDEDSAAELISSATTSVREHVDSIFAKVGVTPPSTVGLPPVVDPLEFTTTSLSDGVVGDAYSGRIETTGGTAPITISASPASDNGVLIGSDGSVSGTPASAADSTFSVTATDSSSPPLTANVALSLHVAVAPAPEVEALAIGTDALAGATVGSPYTASVGITGGTAPYSVSSSPASANGLAVDGTGAIAGTPIEAGDTSFSLSVSDSSSPPLTATGGVVVTTAAAPA